MNIMQTTVVKTHRLSRVCVRQCVCQAENNYTKKSNIVPQIHTQIRLHPALPMMTRYCKPSTQTFIIAAASWHKS